MQNRINHIVTAVDDADSEIYIYSGRSFIFALTVFVFYRNSYNGIRWTRVSYLNNLAA